MQKIASKESEHARQTNKTLTSIVWRNLALGLEDADLLSVCLDIAEKQGRNNHNESTSTHIITTGRILIMTVRYPSVVKKSAHPFPWKAAREIVGAMEDLNII